MRSRGALFAASLFATTLFATSLGIAACSQAPTSKVDDTDDTFGVPGSKGDTSDVTPHDRCTTDADCKAGASCTDVGARTRACVVSKSCRGGAGADATCGGVAGDESQAGSHDCCETRALPGGSYDRFDDHDFPATVSPFLLDTFEVTAGRFRAWVEATDGDLRASAPKEGEGAHPKIAGSGWRSAWDTLLPTSRAEVDAMLGPEKCEVGTNLDDYGALTWWTAALDAKVRKANAGDADVLAENTREALDRKPLDCVPWQVLFAFCVWDGGRLPTDAEWGFATAGGDEQRAFPWGPMGPSELVQIGENDQLSFVPSFAAGAKLVTAALYDPAAGANVFPDNYVHTYGAKFRTRSDNAAHIAPVGKKALGNGRWGHADLAGGMSEWMLDEGPITPGPCTDCANVAWPANDAFDPSAVEGPPDFEHRWFAGGARSIRGGAWDNSLGLATKQTRIEIEWYTSYPVRRTYRALGGRCARDL